MNYFVDIARTLKHDFKKNKNISGKAKVGHM